MQQGDACIQTPASTGVEVEASRSFTIFIWKRSCRRHCSSCLCSLPSRGPGKTWRHEDVVSVEKLIPKCCQQSHESVWVHVRGVGTVDMTGKELKSSCKEISPLVSSCVIISTVGYCSTHCLYSNFQCHTIPWKRAFRNFVCTHPILLPPNQYQRFLVVFFYYICGINILYTFRTNTWEMCSV